MCGVLCVLYIFIFFTEIIYLPPYLPLLLNVLWIKYVYFQNSFNANPNEEQQQHNNDRLTAFDPGQPG